PAHPERDDVVDRTRRDDVTREIVDLVDLLEHPQWLVEPTEPLRLVAAGPDSRVPLPDSLDEVSRDRAHTAASSLRFSAMPCLSSVKESLNFWTPSFSKVSVTSS